MSERLGEGSVVHGRYQVTGVLGEGGMGAVYLVEDRHLHGKQWAMKEMSLRCGGIAYEDTAVRQFEEEARILSGLSHPHLPQVADFFCENERWYLVMERIHGATLRELAEKRSAPLGEDEAVALALQLLDALDYLHSRPRPVVFRDVKPGNVMVTPGNRAVLIDFGIARFFDPEKKTDTLKMGSTGYAPPEQYRGRGTTDPRSDLYALGAMLHHLLTGRDPQDEPPFSFPPVRTLNPSVSPNTERVIMKALEYDRECRYGSARAMAADLAVRKGMLWRIPPVRTLLSTPAAGRFFVPPSAQKDRVALLALLLMLFAVLFVNNTVRFNRERERNRRAGAAAVHVARAAAHREAGQFEKEAAEYEEALKLREDDAAVWHHLGVARVHLERRGAARAAFERAVALNPELGASFRELALLAARDGRMADTVLYIEKIREADPDYPAMQCLRGRALTKQGRVTEATRAYEAFRRLVPREEERRRIEKRLPFP